MFSRATKSGPLRQGVNRLQTLFKLRKSRFNPHHIQRHKPKTGRTREGFSGPTQTHKASTLSKPQALLLFGAAATGFAAESFHQKFDVCSRVGFASTSATKPGPQPTSTISEVDTRPTSPSHCPGLSDDQAETVATTASDAINSSGNAASHDNASTPVTENDDSAAAEPIVHAEALSIADAIDVEAASVSSSQATSPSVFRLCGYLPHEYVGVSLFVSLCQGEAGLVFDRAMVNKTNPKAGPFGNDWAAAMGYTGSVKKMSGPQVVRAAIRQHGFVDRVRYLHAGLATNSVLKLFYISVPTVISPYLDKVSNLHELNDLAKAGLASILIGAPEYFKVQLQNGVPFRTALGNFSRCAIAAEATLAREYPFQKIIDRTIEPSVKLWQKAIPAVKLLPEPAQTFLACAFPITPLGVALTTFPNNLKNQQQMLDPKERSLTQALRVMYSRAVPTENPSTITVSKLIKHRKPLLRVAFQNWQLRSLFLLTAFFSIPTARSAAQKYGPEPIIDTY